MSFFIAIEILLVFGFPAVLGTAGTTATATTLVDICQPTRCRNNGPLIQFPFRLANSQPQHCGFSPAFDLHCNENNQTILQLPVSLNVSLRTINYRSQTLEFHDTDNCLARKLPSLNLSTSRVPSTSPFTFTDDQYPQSNFQSDYVLYNCSTTDPERDPYIIPCLTANGYQVIWMPSSDPTDFFPSTSCTRLFGVRKILPNSVFSAEYLRLGWTRPACGECEARRQFCSLSNNNTASDQIQCIDKPKGPSKTPLIAGATVGSIVFVAILALLYYVYRLIKIDRKIEKFLKDYRALRPTRFSYADIKHITKDFTKKLGEGGYGVVYKGKLSNEIYVAVKVLNSANGNGQEFVNEVGIIGSIHHVNIVRLVGFCADGFRRALVYEYLPNGSLEKFILRNGPGKISLTWEKMEEIAIGVAKGIEYLHRGCDQQILHFDIKPHNILLDYNLNPKICDFGLSKFCSKEQSAVSMTDARGTMGYIAPEMMSRTFGRVSHKSDVYSFGMMLLEMVGRLMNIGSKTCKDNVYFTKWIYNHLREGGEVLVKNDEGGIEDTTARKLAIVGLWCIQWYPADRPSMKMVVQRLEEDGHDLLSFPPDPFPGTGNVEGGIGRYETELEAVQESGEDLV